MIEVSPAEAKPVERAVEARPVDDALGSMVRCLTFARTYIISGEYLLLYMSFNSTFTVFMSNFCFSSFTILQ